MRRPGLWVTNGHPGDPTEMLSWNPASVTCFYDYLAVNGIYQYKAANPEIPIIVRFQHPQKWWQDPTYYARTLGEMVASKWNDMKVLDPYVYYANEMNLHYENGDPDPGNQHLYTTPEFYKKYASWVRATAEVIKNLVPEMKLITPPFAFGHHEDGSPDCDGNPVEGWAGYDYLYETVRDYFDNILTFHAYWGYAGGSVKEWLYDPETSSWYAFRWRRVLKLFKTRYGLNAKMIIDEAGNFGASDLDFTDQVIYFAQNCLSDPRVMALTYFLWLDPTNSPGNVPNSWVQRAQNLSDHLTRLKSMPEVPVTDPMGPCGPEPPEPEPEQMIRVLFPDGRVETMPLEEYLRAVVPAEMPALWPQEAVKAQAVAARSYAQYAIEHPRHPDADICTTTHCQVYNPAMIHPASDKAIEATRGIIGLFADKTINTVFSANCGGHTKNNQDVFGGAPVPYLQGVPCPDKGEQRGHGVGMCQYGARAFADQGYTYDRIIKHYYTGVTLGSITGPPPVQTSIIFGIVFNYTDQPVPNVRVVLTGQGQFAETTSQSDGSYRFANVPAGTYQLALPDYGVVRENITTFPGQDLKIDLTIPAPVTVEITRGPGLPLIVGDWGTPNVPISVTPPQGGSFMVKTGTKLEYGAGGFEFYATEIGIYVLEIEVYRFEIPMNGQYTHLTFRKGVIPPEEQVRLVSTPMLRTQAENILQTELETNPATQGLFKIVSKEQ
jgi:hypothetical protein